VVGPLLDSKVHVPSRRSAVVARPRLTERLNGASRSALTLLSAPAGFGKTTLLTEWLATVPDVSNSGPSIGWLSLDHGDNEPAVFWTYVATAIEAAVDGVGSSALPLLESSASTEVVLAALLNDLSSSSRDLLLVLDDYHLIDSHDIQDGMAFLLDHQPPRLHLILATRADPTLALSRLRARGDLVEIRAADLRFTAEESAAYLNGPMGLVLTRPEVAALDGRTEGWIAALQLAALSMQGRDDIGAFIAGFTGDDRYIVDYLADEVLTRQPAEVRDFLLKTSILDRLTGPLCDAVTGRDGGKAALVALERANLFVVPLDDRRQWFRYHHLFADVLQAHLMEQYPDDLPELHRRASAWYEANGELSTAVRHVLAAGDVERAADLIERAMPALQRSRQESTIRGWLDAIPDEVVRVRPVLALGFVGALMSGGVEFDDVERRLQDLERWLPPTDGSAGAWEPPVGMVVADEAELPRLPGAIEMYRAGLALVRGDSPATIRHAQLAIELAVDDDHVVRAAAAALSGLAYWGGGDLEAAHRGYSVCVQGLQLAGHISDVLGCSITLADIRITQGRLGDAERTYEEALRLAAHETGPPLRGTADMYVGLSRIACERDDLPAAAAHLERARELGEHTWLPQNPYRWRVAMAHVREAEGDLEGALDLVDEADRVYVGDFSPNVRPVPAMRARVRIRRGELSHARDWARERQLSWDDDLSYLREFEHLTLARLLLARHATERVAKLLDQATSLLGRVLIAAEEGGRTGTVIEVLGLQALAQQSRGDAAGSLAPLRRAVTLAEPEGYVRVFADEGLPLAALLKALAKQATAPRYVRRLLAAAGRTAPAAAVMPDLVEPLSGRELEVLRLLGTDLDGPDIARQLSVSLNTMRSHTKNIYAKLGVTSRRAAVRHAHELDLL
jgi:LuxR family maltose regulon positive regulatory protein